MNKLTERINNFLLAIEHRCGIGVTALLTGLVLLLMAACYVTPQFDLHYHGEAYAFLSTDPFDVNSNLKIRYRILAPFLGYITFLRGSLFMVIPLLFNWLFLSAVYYIYRKVKKNPPVVAWCFAMCISFSCTVFIPLIAAGYTDPVSYFFLLLAFTFVNKPLLSATAFGLALLNHENALFLLPPLIYYRYAILSDKSKTMKYVTLIALCSVPYFSYRMWINQTSTPVFDLAYYLTEKNISTSLWSAKLLLPEGVFFAFKLFWFFPLWMMIKLYIERSYRYVIVLLMIIVLCICQLIVAYDITRLICLAFPAILLAAERYLKIYGQKKFLKTCFLLIVLNFLIPQYFVSKEGTHPLFPWIYSLCSANFRS